MISGWRLAAARIGALLVLGGAWQLATSADKSLQDIIPPLTTTLRALGTLASEGSFWASTGQTIRAAVIGLAICVVLGVLVGVVLSARRSFTGSTMPLIDFFRTVPPLALVPLGVLLFGPTGKLDILMVSFATFWPILLSTIYGVRSVDTGLVETARSYRTPMWRRLLFVLIPASAPGIATGIRVGATIALLVAIANELIAGSPGLGQLMMLDQQNDQLPPLYALLIISGLLGVLVNLGLRTLEHRALMWHYAPREAALR